jgi:hypothetical protein
MKATLKKMLLATFIMIELAVISAYSAVPVQIPASDTELHLKPKVTITFTIARRRDCEGFGICDWQVEITYGRINNCTATFYTDDVVKGNFVLEINKATGLSAEAYAKYLKSGYFLMEDESPVPGDILRELGVSGSKTLLAGRYKTLEKNGMIYISIPAR